MEIFIKSFCYWLIYGNLCSRAAETPSPNNIISFELKNFNATVPVGNGRHWTYYQNKISIRDLYGFLATVLQDNKVLNVNRFHPSGTHKGLIFILSQVYFSNFIFISGSQAIRNRRYSIDQGHSQNLKSGRHPVGILGGGAHSIKTLRKCIHFNCFLHAFIKSTKIFGSTCPLPMPATWIIPTIFKLEYSLDGNINDFSLCIA